MEINASILRLAQKKQQSWSLIESDNLLLNDAIFFIQQLNGQTGELDDDQILQLISRGLCCGSTLSKSQFPWEVIYIGSVCFLLTLITKPLSEMIAKQPFLVESITSTFLEIFEDISKLPEPRVQAQICQMVKIVIMQNYVDIDVVLPRIRAVLVDKVNQNWERKISTFHANNGTVLPMDDTTGWNELEAGLSCLQGLVLGIGERKKDWLECADGVEILESLVRRSAVHISRHIRQKSFEFCGELIRLISRPTLMSLLDGMIAEALRTGLQDEWSQIRLAACNCAHEYFSVFHSELLMLHDPVLLPRICLNRHFHSAVGVEESALKAWRAAVGQNGLQRLTECAPQAAEYFTSASNNRNHEIAEASLSAIAEFMSCLQESTVRPWLPTLATSLVACIEDTRWPVRDAACVSSGVFMSKFPADALALNLAGIIVDAWMAHLGDSIYSVRDNALTAVQLTLQSRNTDACTLLLERMENYVRLHLNSSAEPEVGSFLPPGMLNKPENVPSSSGAGPASRLMTRIPGTREKWGCCIDCVTERDASKQELTLSAILLLRVWMCSGHAVPDASVEQLWAVLRKEDKRKQTAIVVAGIEEISKVIDVVGPSCRQLVQFDTNLSFIMSCARSSNSSVAEISKRCLSTAERVFVSSF